MLLSPLSNGSGVKERQLCSNMRQACRSDWSLVAQVYSCRVHGTGNCTVQKQSISQASCCDSDMQPQDPGQFECHHLDLQAGNVWPCRSATLYQETF